MDRLVTKRYEAPTWSRENKITSRSDDMQTRNLQLEKSWLKKNKEMNSFRAANPAGLMPYSGDSSRQKGPFSNVKDPKATNQYMVENPMPDTEEALLEYLYKIKGERDSERIAASKKLEQRKNIRDKYTIGVRNADKAYQERNMYSNRANNNKEPANINQPTNQLVNNNNAGIGRDGLGNNSYSIVKSKKTAVICRMPRFDNALVNVPKESRNDSTVRKTVISDKILPQRMGVQNKVDDKGIANSERKKFDQLPSKYTVKDEVPSKQTAPTKGARLLKYQQISKCSQTLNKQKFVTNKDIDAKSKVSKKIGGKLRGKVGRLFSSDHKQTANPSETAVAKWEPSCINRQTKPYYEAWVDKTLTAFYKTKKDDEIDRAKRNILESYQRKLILGQEFENQIKNRDLKDEKFVGKIRVKR